MTTSAHRIATFAALVAVLAALTLIRGSTPAEAIGFWAITGQDGADANPGDFICETSPGNGICTLRAAVMETNAIPGEDLIRLSSGEFPIAIDNSPRDEDDDSGALGDIDIWDDLRIEGAGGGTSLIEGRGSGIFDIHEGVTVELIRMTLQGTGAAVMTTCGSAIWNRGDLTVRRLTITNNFGRHVGAICNIGSLSMSDSTISANRTALSGWGGGIHNNGTAILERVTVSDNYATMEGGGIHNQGELTISESTVNGNATGGVWGGAGAGIHNSGTLTLVNTTISKNVANFSFATDNGGGLANFGTATLTNVTLAFNETEAGIGGGVYDQGSLTMTNTIVANNIGGDCSGTITSGGHNIDSDGSCGLGAPGDLSGADPVLGPLADNGGPTVTHAILEGSPAIDAADADACPGTDQRGALRAADCDIGAFEAAAVIPTPTTTPVPTGFPSKRGDLDCDDDVDSTDALAILRYKASVYADPPDCPLLGATLRGSGSEKQPLFTPLPPAISPTPKTPKTRGDIDCDSDVDAVDALTILKYVAGFDLELPPGCAPLEPASDPASGLVTATFAVVGGLGLVSTGLAVSRRRRR